MTYLTSLKDHTQISENILGEIIDENHGFEDKGRTVLIIGGAGYIGSPVTSYLLRSGYRVRNLDQLVYATQASMMPFLAHPNYEYVLGDMGDKVTLEKCLDGVSDVIILAGLVGDPITKKFPEESAMINDRGIMTCIDTLNGKGLNKVIFVSTCSNYGMIEENVLADETFDLKPLSLYAKSKVQAEQYILSLKDKVDYCATILRFATAFGLAPRMRFDLTVNEFTRDLFLNKDLLVYDAHTWRPYCHVKDFSRLMEIVLAFPKERIYFEVFNAGGEVNNHTKQSIVDHILAKLPGRNVSYKENSDDPRNYRVNFNKVRETLFFEPAYTVEDGIAETIWALDNKLLDDVEARRSFYGNYELINLPN